jgi:hypothetical protein
MMEDQDEKEDWCEVLVLGSAMRSNGAARESAGEEINNAAYAQMLRPVLIGSA